MSRSVVYYSDKCYLYGVPSPIHAVQSLDDQTDMYVWRVCDPYAAANDSRDVS